MAKNPKDLKQTSKDKDTSTRVRDTVTGQVLASKGVSLKTTTLSSKGQITVSAEARKRLRMDKGTNLVEVVTDNCVVYIPQDVVLEDIITQARQALEQSGVTADELNASIMENRAKRFKERFPDLSNE